VIGQTLTMPSPSVSVVLPAYNPGSLLHRSIDSVRAQSLTDWELLVIDDGGADDLSWVEMLDPRVRRVRQQNRGVSTARNVGVSLAAARFVAFLDQDDEWLPEKLEAQVEVMEEDDGATLCYTGFEWVHPDRVVPHDPTPVTYHGLLHDQTICLSSTMARRDTYWAVGGHDPLMALMQDYDWFLRMARLAEPVSVERILCRYHVHGGNTSDTWTTDYRRGMAERNATLRAHLRVGQRLGETGTVEAARAGIRWTSHIYGPMAYDQFRGSVRARRPSARHLAESLRMVPGYTLAAMARRARNAIGRDGSP